MSSSTTRWSSTATIPVAEEVPARYMYEVLDAFETPDDGTGASLQTLELATSLFDRYTASLAQPFMDRENLELLCVACVSLGTKFHEVQYRTLSPTRTTLPTRPSATTWLPWNPAYSRPSNGTFA